MGRTPGDGVMVVAWVSFALSLATLPVRMKPELWKATSNPTGRFLGALLTVAVACWAPFPAFTSVGSPSGFPAPGLDVTEKLPSAFGVTVPMIVGPDGME